jgi:hypothetical protein
MGPVSLALRVVVEHIPNQQYAILGLATDAECLPVLQVGGITFYRAQSTPRWVLYKRAIAGWGERKTLDPRQQ